MYFTSSEIISKAIGRTYSLNRDDVEQIREKIKVVATRLHKTFRDFDFPEEALVNNILSLFDELDEFDKIVYSCILEAVYLLSLDIKDRSDTVESIIYDNYYKEKFPKIL